MADQTTLSIRPVEGRRLIAAVDGCTTLAGLPIAAGTDIPAEGALVPRGVWAIRCIGRGDAEPVPSTPTPTTTRRTAPSGEAA